MKVCQTMLSVTAPKLALGPVQERERGPPISPFMVPFQVRGWGVTPSVCSRLHLSHSVVPFQVPLDSLAITFVPFCSFMIVFQVPPRFV